jgi:hypothetical protein
MANTGIGKPKIIEAKKLITDRCLRKGQEMICNV